MKKSILKILVVILCLSLFGFGAGCKNNEPTLPPDGGDGDNPPSATTEILDAREMVVGDTLDFNAVVDGKTAKSVIDHKGMLSEETLSGTSVTFAKEQAGDHSYTIEMTDQSLYTLDVFVWSLLIKNEADLRGMHDAANIRAITDSYSGFTSNVFEGYYKLGADVTLTEKWTFSDCVAPARGRADSVASTLENGTCLEYNAFGWHGIFDGDGHTISGLELSGNEASLFGVMGDTSVVKNVKITGVTFTDLTSTTYRLGAIASFVEGGTVQDVTLEYIMPATLVTDLIAEKPSMSGAMFGDVGNTDGCYSQITMNRVTVKATARESDTNDQFTAFGRNRESRMLDCFLCEDVLVSGGAIYHNGEEIKTEYPGITMQEFPWETEPANAVKTEKEVGETLHFPTLLDVKEEDIQEIVRVEGSEETPVSGVSVTFEKSTTFSYRYQVRFKDGNQQDVLVQVWTKIIRDVEDFCSMDEECISVKVAPEDISYYSYAFYGYFKLATDLTLTEDWTDIVSPKGAINTEGVSYQHDIFGFQGIIDGDGHKVDGLRITSAPGGLIGVMGKNGILRNITFENVVINASNWAQRLGLIAQACGGTIEDVTLSVDVQKEGAYDGSETMTLCGALIGDVSCNDASEANYFTTITIRNVLIRAKSSTKSDRAIPALGYYRHVIPTKIPFACENVVAIGCATVYDIPDGLSGVDPLHYEGVTLYATEEEFEQAQQENTING